MVLYFEFFLNLLGEFFITCIVNIDDLYPFALILLPILLFVCGALIRLAFQAVVISWSLNCDKNGDIESVDHSIGLAALQKRVASSQRLLYSFTNSARNVLDFEEEDRDIVKKYQATNTLELVAHSTPDSDQTVTPDQDDFTVVYTPDDDDTVADKQKETNDVHLQTPDSKPSSSINAASMEASKRRKSQRRSRRMRQKEREVHRAKMGDYFMSTCWRLGFFFYSMIAACLGAASLQVDIVINGFFWQLCMRYMTLGGVVWTITYSVAAFCVAVASRYRSWKLIHSDIPRYKLFFLVDAHDLETNNRGWTRTKMFIMFTSLSLFVLFVLFSWIFINETWSSFIHFIGIIFALCMCTSVIIILVHAVICKCYL